MSRSTRYTERERQTYLTDLWAHLHSGGSVGDFTGDHGVPESKSQTVTAEHVRLASTELF